MLTLRHRPAPSIALIFRRLRSLPALAAALLLAACGGDSRPGTDIVGVTLTPATPGIYLLAGGLGGPGNVDATGTSARFNQPMGVAVAADGSRYLADSFNHTIRRIASDGTVTTVAGKAGVPGAVNGSGSAARFDNPNDVAVAPDGTLYVTDTANHLIRRIASDGTVTTLAGAAGLPGTSNGSGSAARFNFPYSLALGSDGSLYVADTGNHVIRKISPAGVVSTLAGLAGSSGFQNGTQADARFSSPYGLTVDSTHTVYVADSNNHTVRKITPAGVVTTLAGAAQLSGSDNGTGTAARFKHPFAIATGPDDSLYVADSLNHTIRHVTTAGVVTTLAGSAGNNGNTDATGAAARFSTPAGIAVDSSGTVHVSDSYNHQVRILTPAGVVTTVAGSAVSQGSDDAVGAAARFRALAGTAVTSDGTVYVADSLNHTIRRIAADGTVTTLAGTTGTADAADGTGTAASFSSPAGVAVDTNGTVYVADSGNHAIRKITPAGVVTTLAGSPGNPGSANGTGTAARFSNPYGVAVDVAGTVYVADTGTHTIRKISPAGVVTTLAGQAGYPDAQDGTGTAARFRSPFGVTVAHDGYLYVTDTGNQAIRKISPAGVVTTLAGSADSVGSADGSGGAASFNTPAGLAVDADGYLYVSDSGNHAIRKVTPAGVVTTLAGSADSVGVVTGDLPGSLNTPLGMAIGPEGELYVSAENAVLKIVLPTPASTFGVSLAASATTLTLGQTATLSWAAYDASACTATGAWSGSQATSGSYSFTPGSTGSYDFTLSCDEDGGTATDTASVTIVVSHPQPTLTLTAPALITPGESFTLSWSATNASSCTATGAWSGNRTPGPGSEDFTPAVGTHVYRLECSGAGGTVLKEALVTVASPPQVTLSASASSVKLGTSLTLTWTSTHATACSASGDWSGSRILNGSQSVTPLFLGNQTFNLTCSGEGGSAIQAVVVNVQAAETTAPPSSGASGGGATGLEALAGLGLLALLRRRRWPARRE